MNWTPIVKIGRAILLCLLLAPVARANVILADFETTKGDFTVSLDFQNAPYAVANFIHLAGKPDDILETALGVPELSAPNHSLNGYWPTAESDVQRLPLTVALIPATQNFRAFYGIFQNQVMIGGVETTSPRGYYPDISGEDRIRLENLSFNPTKYRITLKYPRPWLDARDQRIKETPMYRLMKVHRVDRNRRFFAGTMTDDPFEHPGYHFQDEVARNLGNLDNPFGIPFNQAGILAMDTVAPNRNGSGFFITTGPEPSYNGRYTAFGQVTSGLGLQVVQDIADTGTLADGSLSEDIFIIKVTIRRSGVLANAFFEGFQQQNLPGIIRPMPYTLENGPDGLSLVSALRPQSFNVTYLSPDLRNFTGGLLEAQSPIATEGRRSDLSFFTSKFPRYFFKGFTADIPRWPSGELDLGGARFLFSANSGQDRGALSMIFGSVIPTPPDEEDDGLVRVGGVYSIDMLVERTGVGVDPELVLARGSGEFLATYHALQRPYEGRLTFSNVTGPLNAEQLILHFDSGPFFNNPQVNPALLVRRFNATSTKLGLSYGGVFQKTQ